MKMEDKEIIESTVLMIVFYKGKIKDLEERIETHKSIIEKSRRYKRNLEMIRVSFETIVRELEKEVNEKE